MELNPYNGDYELKTSNEIWYISDLFAWDN